MADSSPARLVSLIKYLDMTYGPFFLPQNKKSGVYTVCATVGLRLDIGLIIFYMDCSWDFRRFSSVIS